MEQRQDRERQDPYEPGARTEGSRNFRYRAFISYSHEDQAWADWLIKALETYRIPQRLRDADASADPLPRRLTPIFRDRDELASASDLGDTIREALADSANLIVICSPASANSHWVNEEIRVFQELGRSQHIFCLIVAGEPNASALPGQEYKECLAPTLRQSHDERGASTHHFIEPAAADVRPGMDSKATARLKLAAGLLGVGLDHLRRRDQQRRTRRMIAVTALALVVTAITTTLAITAIFARQSAEAAKQAAERRQKQAEDLVSFMLGDLSDRLTEVGRLDIMQSVDDKAMDYFVSLPIADVTDQSLAMRATALQKIGVIHLDQGHFDKALQSFQLAMDIDKRLLDKDPGNAIRLSNYGYSQIYIGFAYWRMGDLARAESEFRSANRVLDRALAAKPDDPDIKMQLADALNNLGEVLRTRNKPGQALAMYRRRLGLIRNLLAKHPENTFYVTQLFISTNNVASIEFGRGRLLHAIREFIDTRRTMSQLRARNPRNRGVEYYLMISNAQLANALHATGRQELAMRYIGRSIAIGTTLVRVDPTNSKWRMMLDSYSVWQARWQRQTQANSLPAYQALEKLTSSLAQLYKANPKDAMTRRSFILAQISLASAARDLGRMHAADTYARAASASLQPLPDPKPSNAQILRMACQIELLLGHLDPSRHDSHAARALALIQPVAERSNDPRDLSPWMAALLETGHRNQAVQVAQRLRTMGYLPRDLKSLLARWRIERASDPKFEARLDAALSGLHATAGGTGTDAHANDGTSP